MPKIIATKAANKTMIRKCLTSSSRLQYRTHPACSNNSGVPRPSKIDHHIPTLPVVNDLSQLCWQADSKGRVIRFPNHKNRRHTPENPSPLHCANHINALRATSRRHTLPKQRRRVIARAPDGLDKNGLHRESPRPNRLQARPLHRVFPLNFLSRPKSAPSQHNSTCTHSDYITFLLSL